MKIQINRHIEVRIDRQLFEFERRYQFGKHTNYLLFWATNISWALIDVSCFAQWSKGRNFEILVFPKLKTENTQTYAKCQNSKLSKSRKFLENWNFLRPVKHNAQTWHHGLSGGRWRSLTRSRWLACFRERRNRWVPVNTQYYPNTHFCVS